MLDNGHIRVSQVRAFELNVVRIHCLVMVVLGSEVLYSERKPTEAEADVQYCEFRRAHQNNAQEFIAQMQSRAKEVE